MAETIVVAIGGNSLITDSAHITVHDQYNAVVLTVENLCPLFTSDNKIAIVHGNGPQVGFILRRSEIARSELHMVPLDSCVADTEGAIGYGIQMAIRNALHKRGRARQVATVVTEVLVDVNDSAFADPTKPIGSFMNEEEARRQQEKEGWNIREDAGRGWRRVVPSPVPQEIIEMPVIRKLVEDGTITIAVGGGGIPVIRDGEGLFSGVEAVIDKDLAAAMMAVELKADKFIISTAVEKVCLNFGKPNQRELPVITVSEARKYIEEGHFAKGSMLPKVEAMMNFVTRSGRIGIITDPEHLVASMSGGAGTRIIP
ncbi:MAG: carbamate kinase [spirochete symbiont of Stewartia floridana]|nr:MAG: carbamate kinase [spirochete symbiont of Stewartia floridana]